MWQGFRCTRKFELTVKLTPKLSAPASQTDPSEALVIFDLTHTGDDHSTVVCYSDLRLFDLWLGVPRGYINETNVNYF